VRSLSELGTEPKALTVRQMLILGLVAELPRTVQIRLLSMLLLEKLTTLLILLLAIIKPLKLVPQQ
jgi:hypothetical protein